MKTKLHALDKGDANGVAPEFGASHENIRDQEQCISCLSHSGDPAVCACQNLRNRTLQRMTFTSRKLYPNKSVLKQETTGVSSKKKWGVVIYL